MRRAQGNGTEQYQNDVSHESRSRIKENTYDDGPHGKGNDIDTGQKMFHCNGAYHAEKMMRLNSRYQLLRFL